MIFTDLDGTLIDHHSYDHSAAQEALDVLAQIGAGVVLASSKTGAEIARLRRELSLNAWPAIVENGAGVLLPHAEDGADTEQYQALRRKIDGLPDDMRALFTGFDDMTAEEVAARTGLSLEGAMRARMRAYSEPGLWAGTPQQQEAFVARLAARGMVAQQGGRFLTLSFGATKADQVRSLIAQYRPEITIALGDAPNDIAMIEACDHGVIIANPTRSALPPLAGEATGKIQRIDQPGPIGWNTAILGLLARLNLTRNT